LRKREEQIQELEAERSNDRARLAALQAEIDSQMAAVSEAGGSRPGGLSLLLWFFLYVITVVATVGFLETTPQGKKVKPTFGHQPWADQRYEL
jgi:hypothetical protein